MISGSTRLAAVIGSPVEHSLSPTLHNAAYEALGLDWVYLAFEVPAGRGADALDAAAVLGLVGISVTMPHKHDAAARCDDLTDDAALLHSVNTVTVQRDGRLLGDSTDGEGFVRSLRAAGHDPAGAPVLVLGAGGAARAVTLACARAGAEVSITARRASAADDAARALGVAAVAWEDRDAAARTTAIVVNATPLGMTESACPLDPGAVGAGQVYADLVYHPRETAMMAAAAASGADVVGGIGMLVHQAALQVERWSGRTAPVDIMRSAVERALVAR